MYLLHNLLKEEKKNTPIEFNYCCRINVLLLFICSLFVVVIELRKLLCILHIVFFHVCDVFFVIGIKREKKILGKNSCRDSL